ALHDAPTAVDAVGGVDARGRSRIDSQRQNGSAGGNAGADGSPVLPPIGAFVDDLVSRIGARIHMRSGVDCGRTYRINNQGLDTFHEARTLASILPRRFK